MYLDCTLNNFDFSDFKRLEMSGGCTSPSIPLYRISQHSVTVEGDQHLAAQLRWANVLEASTVRMPVGRLFQSSNQTKPATVKYGAAPQFCSIAFAIHAAR